MTILKTITIFCVILFFACSVVLVLLVLRLSRIDNEYERKRQLISGSTDMESERTDVTKSDIFINAAINAARVLPKGRKVEFLCPCCDRTAFVSKASDIGDSYAWCECGMKYYAKGSEEFFQPNDCI